MIKKLAACLLFSLLFAATQQVDNLISGVGDGAGSFLSNGTVEFFENDGSSTYKDVYSDANKTTVLSQPINLNSNGQAIDGVNPIGVFAEGYYKVVYKQSDGTTYLTIDGVSYGDIVTASNFIDIKSEYGTNTTALENAITDIGSTEATFLFSSDTYTVASNLTFPSNVTLYVLHGSKFDISTGVSMIVQGDVFAGQYEIFTGLGDITLSQNSYYDEWEGNSGLTAISISGNNLYYDNASIDIANITYSDIGTVSINTSTIVSSSIDSLNASNARLITINSDYIESDVISSDLSYISSLNVDYIENDTISTRYIDNGFIISSFNIEIGNGLHGDDLSSAYSSMGGEYLFKTITIDSNITVSSSVGWLVIRADTLIVNKSGGATINAKGKSVRGGSAGTGGATGSGSSIDSDDVEFGYCVGGQGGTGGSGNRSDGTGTSGDSGDCKAWVSLFNINNVDGALGVSPGSGDTAGNDGEDAIDIDNVAFNYFINNPISFGQGGSGGTGGTDDGAASSSGGNGGNGGAGVAIFVKNLILNEDLVIITDGDDGSDGTGTTGEASGGGGGGGGAGGIVLVYGSKTGSGNISLSANGGTGGSFGAGSPSAGSGGNGANSISVEVNLSSNEIL